MKVLLCLLSSLVMFYLTYGLDDCWALAWFAPLPLLWLAYSDVAGWKLAGAGFLAYAAGVAYVFQAYGTYLWVTGVVISVVGGALFVVALLAARAAWRFDSSIAVLLAFPTLWTAIEFLSARVSAHGSFGALGYTQVSWPASIQLATITGVHGVSFLLCLSANSLALILSGRHRCGGVGVALCALAVIGGYLRLAQPQGENIRVAALAVSAGDAASETAVSEAYAQAIRAQAGAGAEIIVTPEASMQRGSLRPVAEAAATTNTLVVVGASQREPRLNLAIAFVVGQPPLAYVKRHHLVLPGGAYIAGTRPGVIGAGMAMAICKDMDFAQTIRSDARQGIRLMMVPAEDFVRDDWLHARIAIMRGVENGFAVVRSAYKGLETVSDSRGNLLARAGVDGTVPLVAIRADVPLGPGPTLYTRIGDLFAWLCVAGGFGLAMMCLLGKRAAAIRS